MKFSIIVGSQRANSNSAKVGKFLEQEILTKFKDSSVFILDLYKTQLPLFDTSLWMGNTDLISLVTPIQKELKESDAVIIISPEWGGMATPAVKNFFLYFTKGELAHKAGLIVATSSGQNAAYPIVDLRAFSYKNTHLCYIPEHLIIRNVGNVLNPEEKFDMENANSDDIYIRERIDYTLTLFNEYAKALKTVRDSNVVDFSKYPNGM
jgi:NAD(P)H-dependent FMN reductase